MPWITYQPQTAKIQRVKQDIRERLIRDALQDARKEKNVCHDVYVNHRVLNLRINRQCVST